MTEPADGHSALSVDACSRMLLLATMNDCADVRKCSKRIRPTPARRWQRSWIELG